MRYLPLIFWHPDIIQGTCKLCKNICLRKYFFAALWCDNSISPSRSCNIESEKWQVDEEEHKFSNPKPKFCKPSCNIIVYDDSISPRTTCSTAGEKWTAGEAEMEAKVGSGPHGCRASSMRLFIEPGNEWCTWDMLAICRLGAHKRISNLLTASTLNFSEECRLTVTYTHNVCSGVQKFARMEMHEIQLVRHLCAWGNDAVNEMKRRCVDSCWKLFPTPSGARKGDP